MNKELEQVVIGESLKLKQYALENNLQYYQTQEEYLNNIKTKKTSLYEFTRKSVVGAFYRVGASFTTDAVLLGIVAGELTDFSQDLDPAKLVRIALYVIGINFVDYRFDITNRLDRTAKKMEDHVKKYTEIKK